MLGVGAAGFEPTTSYTPCKRATELRHAPNLLLPKSIRQNTPDATAIFAGLRLGIRRRVCYSYE